jgi:hypothetical protein
MQKSTILIPYARDEAVASSGGKVKAG